MKSAIRIFLISCIALFLLPRNAFAQQNIEEDSRDYMREELGVNEYTTPSISWLLKELDKFHPIPMEVVDRQNRDKVFSNRLQTSLHFGTLITDGFIVVANEKRSEIQDIGRALLRQSKALGVGNSLTRRSNKLLQLGDQGNWADLREELVGTQKDVENAMIELRDEQMAHMISLGGWLRGFYAGAVATSQSYTVEKANILKNTDILDYYIERLDTLHPKLKKTQFVIAISSRLKVIRKLASEAQNRPFTKAEVEQIRKLAEEINTVLVSKVDAEGNLHD
ncbi:MAG: hypothetical protein ABI443_14090 [Chthoniobacterales bacterium]